MKYYILPFLVIFLFSCQQKEDNSLATFLDHKVEFESQNVTSLNKNFEVTLPKSWKWKHEEYGDTVVENIHAASPKNKEGFISLITIEKLQSIFGAKDLSEDVDLFKIQIEKNEGWKLIDSGETNFLNYPAQFFHYKSDTGTKGESESITFILETDKKGVFYYLNAGGSQSESLEKEMATMLEILSSFKKK